MLMEANSVPWPFYSIEVSSTSYADLGLKTWVRVGNTLGSYGVTIHSEFVSAMPSLFGEIDEY